MPHPTAFVDTSGQGGTLGANLPDYFQAYRDVAAARGLLLIVNYANWLTVQRTNPTQFKTYVADGVHPNNAGYGADVRPYLVSALIPEPTLLACLATVVISLAKRRRLAG